LGALEKDAFKIMLSKTFFDRESVADSVEIFLDKVNGIGFQKTANLMNFLLINPNITGFAPAAVAGTVCTGTGIKAEIKPMLSYNAHAPLPFLPALLLLIFRACILLFTNQLSQTQYLGY
jgi:hypothetical protein